MKIKLNLNIFWVLLLFIITNQIETYVLVMIFAFIHEISHLICGIILGFKPYIFKIIPLGFMVEFETYVEDYNKKILKSNILSMKKVIVALAGPLVNLLIVILGIVLDINSNIIYSNLLIFIFNLVPIYPLDGGTILNNILKIFLGNRKANECTNFITNLLFVLLTMLASVLILIYKNIGILLLIIALLTITIRENRKYCTYNKIYKIIDKINN